VENVGVKFVSDKIINLHTSPMHINSIKPSMNFAKKNIISCILLCYLQENSEVEALLNFTPFMHVFPTLLTIP